MKTNRAILDRIVRVALVGTCPLSMLFGLSTKRTAAE
jgi:hypothetical protein